jgi:hypothetical protein
MDTRLLKQDFDILQVDFEWVAKTDSLRQLRRAQEVVKREGGYAMLEKALADKISSLDKSS